MITEEKIKAVKKALRSGVPEGEIKESLQREGFSNEDIDRVFAPQQYDMRSWYLGFGILFLLGGLWALLTNGNELLLVLSALMFVQYYREVMRLKKEKEA